MKNKTTIIVLYVLTVIFSFLFWWSEHRSITIPGASVWITPMLMFSLLFVFLNIELILAKKSRMLMLVPVFILGSSLFFAHTLGHLALVFAGCLVFLYGTYRIRNEIELNIKISVYRYVRSGCMWIVLAFSLVVSSQYYWEAKDLNSEMIFPQVKIDSLTKSVMPKVLGVIVPDFDSEHQTVDDFILRTSQSVNNGGELSTESMSSQLEMFMPGASQNEVLKKQIQAQLDSRGKQLKQSQSDLILQEGRKKFSDAIGFDVKGDEIFSEVIIKAVNGKFNEVLNHGQATPSSGLAGALALALFMTVYSIGMMGNYFLAQLTRFVFFLMVKSRLVRIALVSREVEVIE